MSITLLAVIFFVAWLGIFALWTTQLGRRLQDMAYKQSQQTLGITNLHAATEALDQKITRIERIVEGTPHLSIQQDQEKPRRKRATQ